MVGRGYKEKIKTPADDIPREAESADTRHRIISRFQ